MVHWEAPGLKAKVENSGHGDACGPIILQDYKHLKDNIPLDDATTNSMRQELINLGLMDAHGGGMTMEQIYNACLHYKFDVVKFVDYQSNLNFEALHADMKIALEAHQFVGIETSNAQALPDNQPGVQYHFILLGGIDSASGYLTANGDTETGLNSGQETTDPVWYGVGALSASKPVGYIILESLDVISHMIILEQDNVGNITGAHDADNTSLHLGAGFAVAAKNDNLLGEHITLEETYITTKSGASSYCVLSDRYVGGYNIHRNVAKLVDDFEIAEIVETLSAAPKPTVDNDSAVAAALALVSQDAANVAMHASHVEEFVIELQKDINTLTIAQNKD